MAAIWSPISFYDNDEARWYMTFVGYACPGNSDGVILLAQSTVAGPDGIGGPYVSAGVLHGLGVSEGGPAPLLGLYGSSNGASYWSVGLARSDSGTIRGPWTRAPTGNPLQVNGQRMENPIVLKVALARCRQHPSLRLCLRARVCVAPLSATHSVQFECLTPRLRARDALRYAVAQVTPPNASAPLLIAVFDDIAGESEGFGMTWSLDGIAWTTGQLIAVPGGGARAPMGLIDMGDGTVLVVFNRKGSYDSLWTARFKLDAAPPPGPFNPPDHTALTARACVAGSEAQRFLTDVNGTIRLAANTTKCVDLFGCDTTAGVMDVWACHVPGDGTVCGGSCVVPLH